MHISKWENLWQSSNYHWTDMMGLSVKRVVCQALVPSLWLLVAIMFVYVKKAWLLIVLPKDKISDLNPNGENNTISRVSSVNHRHFYLLTFTGPFYLSFYLHSLDEAISFSCQWPKEWITWCESYFNNLTIISITW